MRGPVESVVVVHQHLDAAHHIVVPPVEGGQYLFFGHHEQLVVILKVGLVDARDIETAGTDRLLHEVTGKAVALFQLQLIGYLFRYNGPVTACGIVGMNNIAFQQVRFKKIPIVSFGNSFEHHSHEIFVRFDDSRFGDVRLKIANLRVTRQDVSQRIGERDRCMFVGAIALEGRDLDVGAEADHFGPYLVFESHDDAYRRDHHC